ncbi:FUSC family protein [Marmoricola endophyticus]|uniref:FUSC family protein n=1 Tax=Marmoricola endophyticus TaxID=2040280 RepID=A0A917BMN1_9ACTN|nr:aromatic acid exporter family protein [Marmoricola endophyticus]GGF49774.1 FUSC family protein [Marmoricola endophyticus]
MTTVAIRAWDAARRTAATPAVQTDATQVVKAVVAAVAAWLLADRVLDLGQAFLAPWTALLTVHATVYRSLARGAQSVAATVLGIAVAYGAVLALGPSVWALGAALLVGLGLARLGVLRDEGVTVATTALFVLTAGDQDRQVMLTDRLLDVLLGVGVGVMVNLVVLPPINDRSAQQLVDQINAEMGELMQQMAREMRDSWTEERSQAWIDSTRDMDTRIDTGWQLVRHARESSWWNPRRLVSSTVGDQTTYEQVLRRLEDGVAQLRAIARTVDTATRTAQEWDPDFRGPWLDLLADTGRRVADPDAEVGHLDDRLRDLAARLSHERLPGLFWPVYGALISDLQNIVETVDDVASRRPVDT